MTRFLSARLRVGLVGCLSLLGLACANPFSGLQNPFSEMFSGLGWKQVEFDGALQDDPAALRVEQLAQVFYTRVSSRRFNSVATFHDPGLREFFDSEEAFADYFANFVQLLTYAHFEKNRVTRERVEAITLDVPGEALVRVRFWGDNSQPLRWWSVRLVREDRWLSDGDRWFILPGKL